jgi:tetratricopeptide (TPR) repeat protein
VAPDAPYDDPQYIQQLLAEFYRGQARFRWACIFPKGPNFQVRMDQAVEELDEFLQKHFEEAAGAHAMILLGRAFYEKALRLGDAGEGEVAINYFENVFSDVEEKPSQPETFNILGNAFFWYARSCNALAKGEGNLKKPQPIFFSNTLKLDSTMRQKLKHGAKHPMAMKARLEVAEAFAAQRDFERAVGIAGDVLAMARVEGQGGIAKLATGKLTEWVASVRGAGALNPELLFQIGASLAAQGRVGNAITFFEKAVASSRTEDQKEKVAYPAQLEIAKIYRRDKRLFAAAQVGWDVVQDFLKSGADAESDMALTAGEACNQARLAWRAISDATKDAAHESKYQSVVNTFRTKFPAHPENADRNYASAMEEFTRGNYERAAEGFAALDKSSNNYWRGQRRIPQCFRVLAQKAGRDTAKAKELHERTLKAGQDLVAKAKADSSEDAGKAAQTGQLYEAMALASLERWDDALKVIDDYLGKYKGKFLKRGISLKIKVDAHIARNEMDPAEQALKDLQAREPSSPYIDGLVVSLYNAMRAAYKALGTGDKRKDLANRTAIWWATHLESQDEAKLGETHYFAYGEALRDAGRWKEAGEAFKSASGMVADPKRKAYYDLQAAEMTFKAAVQGKKDGTVSGREYVAIMKEARQLFTDVIIPDRSKQAAVLKELANWQKNPRKATTALIKRRPRILLTTAEVYHESTTSGTDGRWIAVRLLDHLHRFTLPTADKEQNPKMFELVPTWWDGAELKLNIFKAIGGSGGDQGRVARTRGYSYAKKLLFQYRNMDGPERVERIKTLERDLK